MNENEFLLMRENARKYDEAMKKMNNFITRETDGTFTLSLTEGRSLGIEEIVFSDLKRSLEETNRMIREGIILASDIED